jgi:hypothetical protein
MVQSEEINDVHIEPVKLPKTHTGKVAGAELFSEPYGNIFLLARKKSGKTTTAYRILDETVGKDTKVWLFGSTVNKDPTYKEIQKMLQDKGSEVHSFVSTFDGKRDILKEVLASMGGESEKPEKQGQGRKMLINAPGFIRVGGAAEPKKSKKTLYPDNVFVFDDLSTELRKPTIAKLLKSNRHYNAKVILIGHALTDMLPESRKQIDYLLLFPGQSEDKLEDIYDNLNVHIPYDQFKELYEYATSERFNFLYVDTVNDKFRHNFNKEITIE